MRGFEPATVYHYLVAWYFAVSTGQPQATLHVRRGSLAGNYTRSLVEQTRCGSVRESVCGAIRKPEVWQDLADG